MLSAGKLYWIQDAYPDSDQFPYSYPHGAGFGDNLNYVDARSHEERAKSRAKEIEHEQRARHR